MDDYIYLNKYFWIKILEIFNRKYQKLTNYLPIVTGAISQAKRPAF